MKAIVTCLLLTGCAATPARDCWHDVIGQARTMRVLDRMIYSQWEAMKDLHYEGQSPERCDAGRQIIENATPVPPRRRVFERWLGIRGAI